MSLKEIKCENCNEWEYIEGIGYGCFCARTMVPIDAESCEFYSEKGKPIDEMIEERKKIDRISWLESIKKSIHGGDEEFDRRRIDALDAAIDLMKSSVVRVHKYPDEKPDRYDDFTILMDKGRIGIAHYNAVDDVWWLDGCYPLDYNVVIAWIDWKEYK